MGIRSSHMVDRQTNDTKEDYLQSQGFFSCYHAGNLVRTLTMGKQELRCRINTIID
jgi:hypothetical protein